MGYSSLSTSRGDGNGSNCVPKKYNAANSIATYLPREGPETLQPTIKLLVLVVCIATYLPREGPETRRHRMQARSYRQYSYQSPSRGAGNISFTKSS